MSDDDDGGPIPGASSIWLALVRRACLKRFCAGFDVTESKFDRAKVLDAAMRSHDPEAYLHGLASAFDDKGQISEAAFAQSLELLYRTGEIELLMFMRAEWLGRFAALQPRPTRST